MLSSEWRTFHADTHPRPISGFLHEEQVSVPDQAMPHCALSRRCTRGSFVVEYTVREQ